MSLSGTVKNKKINSDIEEIAEDKKNKKKFGKLTFTRSFIGMVLFVMAVLLTVCSLYMVAMTAFERATTKGEAGIIALVAACVALSAHLLPALVKGRKSFRLHSMIALIWIVCVAATLYSHTLFFVTTQNDKADIRSENSPEIKNIETLIAQKQEWINEQKVRSVNAINVDITNEKIKIEQILPKVCETCKTNKAKLNSYEIRKTAFEEEKLMAEKVEAEKNKIREMQEEIINKKEEKRTDAVFEKMAKIIPGMSYESFNLSSAITNALLLEILATLFWWLLFPSQKGYKIEGKPGQSSIIKRRDENDGFIVDGEIIPRTIVKGELVEDETFFLENYDPEKINNKNRIAFAKDAYDKDSKNLKYVLYNNEVYPVMNEDLFISKIVLSVIRKKFAKENVAIYKPFASIVSEDFTTVKYVNSIVRKKQNSETLFMVNYVESVNKKAETIKVKEIIKNENDNEKIITEDKVPEIFNTEERIEQKYNFNMALPDEVVKEDQDEINHFYQMQSDHLGSNDKETDKNIDSDIPDFINMDDLFPTNDELNTDESFSGFDLKDDNNNNVINVSNDQMLSDTLSFNNIKSEDPILKGIESKKFKSEYFNFMINYEDFSSKIQQNEEDNDLINISNKAETDYISKFLRLDEYGIKNKSIEKKQKRKTNTSIMDEVYSVKTGKIKETHQVNEKNEEEGSDFENIINDIVLTLQDK